MSTDAPHAQRVACVELKSELRHSNDTNQDAPLIAIRMRAHAHASSTEKKEETHRYGERAM